MANWQELMTTAADWGSYFILTADVDLGGLSLTRVGDIYREFTGIFDGNNNIISNAVINLPSTVDIGLFGYVGRGGQIHNLGVKNVNITGFSIVGGLVGENHGSLTAYYLYSLIK